MYNRKSSSQSYYIDCLSMKNGYEVLKLNFEWVENMGLFVKLAFIAVAGDKHL